MRLPLALAACLAAALPAAAQPQTVAPTDALTPAAEQKSFRLPPGFEAQLVASEPAIGKPIQIAFDAKGRLWVTTSRHYPFAATGPPTDKIYVLADIDPITGRAGKVKTFAADLNIPIGILPLPDCNSCLCSEVGRIVKLTDTDGDGRADRRETILEGFGSKDTHGMTNSFLLLPDGWVYACHGFSNASRVRGTDGHEVAMTSGNTFRFRPDGRRVENWTFGQVNPFGLTCDPWFNLYTADCHSKPITQLIRGAHYDSFGKPHDGLGYAPHATRHDHGSTGLCGLAWLDSPAFPASYNGHMALGNVVTNRVNRDKIEWKGSTPVAVEQPDLLASSDPWFRPSDCKLGPDGALYVADFYNKVIGHYEVDLKHPGRDKEHGRVWRIVYTGGGTKPRPAGDLTSLPTAELDALLGHPSVVVRLAATLEMRRRPGVLKANPAGNEFYQAHRLWVGAREESRPAAIEGVNPPELVEVHRVLRATARSEANPLSATSSVRVARAMIDQLAAAPAAGNLEPALQLTATTPAADTHRAHAAKVMVRNTLAAPGGWAAAAKLPQFRDALTMSALGVPTAEAAAFLAAGSPLPPDALRHIGRYGDDAAVARAVPNLREIEGIAAFHQGRQAAGRELPAAVLPVAVRLCDEGLSKPDAATAVAAANLAGALKLAPLADPLMKLIQRADRPAAVRAAAAQALASCAPAAAVTPLGKLVSDPSADISLREQSAAALGRVNSGPAREALVAAFAVAPAPVAQAVALALATTPAGAKTFVEATAAGKASAQLLTVRQTRDRIEASTGGSLAGEIARLTRDLPTDDGRLAKLSRTRAKQFAAAKPDVMAGKALFTRHCAACHQIANEGSKIGPQLDGVGNRGLDRLLEDILTPNRNVDAAFRATTISTADGRTLTGLVVREEGQVTVLADATGKEVRVPAADIESRRVGNLSPMPANFDTTLTEAEFQDLLGYLLATRAK